MLQSINTHLEIQAAFYGGYTPKTVCQHPFGQELAIPRCECACQIEASKKREIEEKRRQRNKRIRRRKAKGLQDLYLYDYTFANDISHDSAQSGKARAYVEH